MSSPNVDGFAFDEDNEEKIAFHGLTLRQVRQVLDGDHIIVPNRKNRRARYLIIGRDHGGTCIAIPIEPTREARLWRPITAWPCKPHENARLLRG